MGEILLGEGGKFGVIRATIFASKECFWCASVSLLFLCVGVLFHSHSYLFLEGPRPKESNTNVPPLNDPGICFTYSL